MQVTLSPVGKRLVLILITLFTLSSLPGFGESVCSEHAQMATNTENPVQCPCQDCVVCSHTVPAGLVQAFVELVMPQESENYFVSEFFSYRMLKQPPLLDPPQA